MCEHAHIRKMNELYLIQTVVYLRVTGGRIHFHRFPKINNGRVAVPHGKGGELFYLPGHPIF